MDGEGWKYTKMPHTERVGAFSVIVDHRTNDKEKWAVAIIGSGIGVPLIMFDVESEEEARKRACQVELVLCRVASWAARESDTAATRRSLIESMERRCELRDEKPEPFNG